MEAELSEISAEPIECDEGEDINHDILFKVILIGDQAVGKSSILSRITGHEFKDNYDATIGVEFGNFLVNIEGKIVKMQIWDTAGMESFRSITRIFYRGTNLVCVVYDVTKEDSFEHIDEWNQEIENNADKDTMIYLLGNMKDKDDQRQIKSDIGTQKAADLGYSHFAETSAKTKEGIDEVFIRAAKQIYYSNKNRLSDFAAPADNEESTSFAQNSVVLSADGRKSSVHLRGQQFHNKNKNKQKKK